MFEFFRIEYCTTICKGIENKFYLWYSYIIESKGKLFYWTQADSLFSGILTVSSAGDIAVNEPGMYLVRAQLTFSLEPHTFASFSLSRKHQNSTPPENHVLARCFEGSLSLVHMNDTNQSGQRRHQLHTCTLSAIVRMGGEREANATTLRVEYRTGDERALDVYCESSATFLEVLWLTQ